MKKTIIFDMDGVLVDACEWHRIALNESLKEICGYEISLEEHYSTFNGIPTRVKLNILNKRNIVQEEKNIEIENLKQHKTIEIINKLAFPREEKINLMYFLKEKRIKIGCYTNSIRKTSELMLRKTGVFDYLDLLVTNEEVRKPKPDPEGYLICFEKLGVTKQESLIIEDSPKGIEAAKNSGAEFLVVKNINEVNIDLIKEYF